MNTNISTKLCVYLCYIYIYICIYIYMQLSMSLLVCSLLTTYLCIRGTPEPSPGTSGTVGGTLTLEAPACRWVCHASDPLASVAVVDSSVRPCRAHADPRGLSCSLSPSLQKPAAPLWSSGNLWGRPVWFGLWIHSHSSFQ